MKAKQKTKLSMYISVRDYLANFLTILNLLPNFQAFYTALQNAIIQIQNSGELQGFNKSGNTAGKNQFKDVLVRLGADTARKLFAYAKFTNNLVLLNEINIPESDLKRMSDTDLRNHAQGIYNRALENIENLASYTITEESQAALQTAITNFDNSIGKPRIGTTETSQATKLLVNNFKNGDTALDDLDTVVEIIRLTEPNFYNGYKSVRKLVKMGGGKLAIKGIVTDVATGLSLKGAKLTFTMNGSDGIAKSVNGKTSFTKKSAKKGGFIVRNAPEGTYDVMVELPGFQKKMAKVSVVTGQMSALEIVLERE